MKVFKSTVVLMVWVLLIGCGSRSADVKRSSPQVAPPTTPTQQPTPRFSELNDAVNHLGTTLVDGFPTERRASRASGAPVIAVGDFVNAEGEITRLGRVVADKITPVLVRSNRFLVLERALIERVIKEQQFQLSPFADEASAAEFGKIVGAEAIISGTISELGDAFYLNARAIDVERGSLLVSADVEVTRTPALVSLDTADIPGLNPPEVKTRVFRAHGVGFPSPKFKQPGQARLMAFRAAKGDAMRNLVEEIKGSQITSDTTIADLMTQNDTIRMQLNTTLQGARVIRKDEKPDGSVEVEMEVELPEELVQALYGQ